MVIFSGRSTSLPVVFLCNRGVLFCGWNRNIGYGFTAGVIVLHEHGVLQVHRFNTGLHGIHVHRLDEYIQCGKGGL